MCDFGLYGGQLCKFMLQSNKCHYRSLNRSGGWETMHIFIEHRGFYSFMKHMRFCAYFIKHGAFMHFSCCNYQSEANEASYFPICSLIHGWLNQTENCSAG